MKNPMGIVAACLMALTSMTLLADGLVTPPAGLKEEAWKFLSANYRCAQDIRRSYDSTYNYPRHKISYVRDGNTIYLKGIFKDYPDAWIKGCIKPYESWATQVVFDQDQQIGEKEGHPVFFQCGLAAISSEYSSAYDTITWQFKFTKFNYTQNDSVGGSNTEKSLFVINRTHNNIISGNWLFSRFETEGCAFWYTDRPDEPITFKVAVPRVAPFPADSFPNLDYRINIDMCRMAYVEVPDDLPEEDWEMTYDKYQAVQFTDSIYRNFKRDVKIKRSEKEIYFKGLFASYPEAWVKGNIEDNRIYIDTLQNLYDPDVEAAGFDSPYALYGRIYQNFSSGNTFMQYTLQFAQRQGLNLIIQDDGSIVKDGNYIGVFWHSDEPKGFFEFTDGYDFDEGKYGTGFPDRDFPTNMRFTRKDNGVGSVMNECEEGSNVMYDLHGRQVRSDHPRPGIYIRNGRKFVVR